MFSHVFIFNMRMLLQLMMYYSLIGRFFVFLVVHFIINGIFGSVSSYKNKCGCIDTENKVVVTRKEGQNG